MKQIFFALALLVSPVYAGHIPDVRVSDTHYTFVKDTHIKVEKLPDLLPAIGETQLQAHLTDLELVATIDSLKGILTRYGPLRLEYDGISLKASVFSIQDHIYRRHYDETKEENPAILLKTILPTMNYSLQSKENKRRFWGIAELLQSTSVEFILKNWDQFSGRQ